MNVVERVHEEVRIDLVGQRIDLGAQMLLFEHLHHFGDALWIDEHTAQHSLFGLDAVRHLLGQQFV